MPITTSGATPDAGSPATPATPIPGNPEGGRRPSTREEFTAATLASLRGETGQPAKPTPSDPKGASAEPSDTPAGEDTPEVLSHVSDAAAQGAEAAEGDADDEDAEQAEAEDADARESDQRWPKAAVDRVQRHKRQRDEARQELEAVKAELAELKGSGGEVKAVAPSTAPGDEDENSPIRNLRDPAEIANRYQAAQFNINIANDLLDELHDNPDSVADRLRAAGIKLEEYTPATMRAYLREARAVEQKVVQQAPRRIEFMRNEQFAQQEALKIMPELSDTKSDRYKAVQAVVKQYPELKKRADWAYHAAIYALGHEALQAQTKGAKPAGAAPATAAAPKPKLPVPPRVPGASAAQPARATSDQARLEALRQKAFGPDGTREDRQAYTEAQLRGGAR